MSRDLDRKLRQQGTRFRLFPQSPSLPAFLVPEPVYIASPPGSIAAGPAGRPDVRGRPRAQGPALRLSLSAALHRGRSVRRRGRTGTGISTRSARARGSSARRTCSAWSAACWTSGRTISATRSRWHFADLLPSLELIPLVEWDNAQSGFGFIETGHTPATSSVRDALLPELRRARARARPCHPLRRGGRAGRAGRGPASSWPSTRPWPT